MLVCNVIMVTHAVHFLLIADLAISIKDLHCITS